MRGLGSARLDVAAAVLVMAAASAGCSSSSGPSQAAPTTTAVTAKPDPGTTIAIVSDPTTVGRFEPAQLTVGTNTAVHWRNETSAPHAIAFDEGGALGGPVTVGRSLTQTFTVPGRYRYHCSIHPAMTGTVVVQ
jgi:plastocyanin